MPPREITDPDIHPEVSKRESAAETEKRLRAKIRDMFESSYQLFRTSGQIVKESERARDAFDETDHLLDILECPLPEDQRYTKEQRERVPFFFEELYAFVHEQRRDASQHESLKEYLSWWREKSFSVSPNLFNYQFLEQQVITAARFSRLPETRENFGWIHTGELVYELSGMRDEKALIAFLEKLFQQASPEARLDLLHYLTAAGRQAFFEGYANMAGVAIMQFIKKLSDDQLQSPFIHHASRAAYEILDMGRLEANDGMRRVADWQDEVIRHSNNVASNLVPDSRSYAEHTLGRISRDAIASFDGTYLPQSFAWVGKEFDAPRKNIPSSQDIKRLLEMTSDKRGGAPRNLRYILIFGDRLSSTLRNKEWQTFWEAHKRRSFESDFAHVLHDKLSTLFEQYHYTEVHFDLFENSAAVSPLKQSNKQEPIDTSVLLQELHHPLVRQSLENDLGMQLTDLSLREQIQLLSYLASVNTKTAQNGFAAIRQFGLPGARAFLSCEYGQEYGHAILSIANKLETKAAAAIFQKYAELIDLTDRSTEELLKDVLVTEHQQVIDRSKLDEELLRRGKELTAAFAKRIAEQKNAPSTQEVLKEIERAKQDVILMAALFRSTFKGKEASVDFSELKGLTLDTIDPQTLNEQQHEALERELKDILKANWVDKGLPAMEMALHGLEEGLSEKKEKTRFFTLKKNTHIIAFCRFDDRPDLTPDARYVGSFNVSPDLRGSAIGMAFFHEILKREGKEHTLHAHVHADDRIGARYVDELGFAITGVETDVVSDQEPVTWFTLQRFPDKSDEAPISQEREHETSQEQFFAFPVDRTKMLDWVRHETAQGNIISQYIVEPRQGSQPERRRFTSVTRKTLSRAA